MTDPRWPLPLGPDGTPFKCPTCPCCGEPPAMAMTDGGQAYCGNEDCDALMWNPKASPAANLADAGTVSLQEGP